MMTELKPCPFTGATPDFKIYKVEDGYEGKISVDLINLEIFYQAETEDEVKRCLQIYWNARVYPKDVEKAVQKDTQKKPYYSGSYECSECLNYVDTTDDYCSICGQRLDWS